MSEPRFSMLAWGICATCGLQYPVTENYICESDDERVYLLGTSHSCPRCGWAFWFTVPNHKK